MNYSLYDKIWNEHSILVNDDDSELLYIDRHLVHEVTSPQAFDGLAIIIVKFGAKSRYVQYLIIMYQHEIDLMELKTLSQNFKLIR